MNNIDIPAALTKLRPGAQWVLSGDTLDGLNWMEDNNPPTQSEIDEAIAELQAEYDAGQYARDRSAEYPTTDKLIVALWEKDVEGRPEAAEALEAQRQEIKAKYPKN